LEPGESAKTLIGSGMGHGGSVEWMVSDARIRGAEERASEGLWCGSGVGEENGSDHLQEIDGSILNGLHVSGIAGRRKEMLRRKSQVPSLGSSPTVLRLTTWTFSKLRASVWYSRANSQKLGPTVTCSTLMYEY